MMARERLAATVSGSFRRAMSEVQAAVYALMDAGVSVLSPADPRVVDSFGDFLFVASDRLRTIRTVQSRHLAAIAASDFVWLVAPDGYVGPSAAMELGFAAARGVPVLSATPPQDLTMRQFVTVVPGIEAAMANVCRLERADASASALLDPVAAVERAHRHLDTISAVLLEADAIHREQMPVLVESARQVRRAISGL